MGASCYEKKFPMKIASFLESMPGIDPPHFLLLLNARRPEVRPAAGSRRLKKCLGD
jgi:hypothetical protein